MATLYGLKIKTRLSYDGLDNILGQYCRGAYYIGIGGLDETSALARKIMILRFAEEADRNRIKHVFTARKAGASAFVSPMGAFQPLEEVLP